MEFEDTPQLRWLYKNGMPYDYNGVIYKILTQNKQTELDIIRQQFNQKFDLVEIFFHRGFCYPVKINDQWVNMSFLKYQFIQWLLEPNIFDLLAD